MKIPALIVSAEELQISVCGLSHCWDR